MRGRLAPEFYFAIPGDPNTLTGGFIYDRRVIAALQNSVMPVRPLIWPANFPFPSSDDRACVAVSLSGLPDDSVVVIDGLAFGALPELMIAEAQRLRLIALVHHPLGYETGLPPDIRNLLIESERQALSAARHVITTSNMTARSLVDHFGVQPNRLTVALPGGDPPRGKECPPRPMNTAPRLLSVGAVIPRKGHDLLVQALDRIADLPWNCVIAGSLDRDKQATAQLRAAVAASGVEARIHLVGEVDDVQPLYAQADIFVLASHYEGYGMAFAEALRYGLPIIGTTGGAIPEAVPIGASLLTAPGDVSKLTSALRAVLTDTSLRQALTAGARRAALAQPSWLETASIFVNVIRELNS
jgi:glycosyltransferase involved in cell wall biosynthesis